MCGYPFTHLLLLSICLHNQKYSSSPKDSLLLLDFLLEDFLLEDFLLDFFEVLPVVVVLLGITGAGSVMVTAVVVLQPPEEMVIVISPEERAVISPFLLIVGKEKIVGELDCGGSSELLPRPIPPYASLINIMYKQGLCRKGASQGTFPYLVPERPLQAQPVFPT